MVTAKDKLREMLGKGLTLPTKDKLDQNTSVAVSAERADDAERMVHGIDAADLEALVGRSAPEIYSGDASLYVLDAGIGLIKGGRADFCYLSTTDFMQHTYAPEDPEMLNFIAEIDERIGNLLDLGAVVAATADHGMNYKVTPDGEPNVVYLESLLSEKFGENLITVICPITDPYVVHHGALGSAVTIHLDSSLDAAEVHEFVTNVGGVVEVYSREQAVQSLELPGDRIGDLYVLGARNVVLGRRKEYHELSKLRCKLRSHGGRYEDQVPMLLSEPVRNNRTAAMTRGDLRNYDIFDLACNYQ